GFLAELEEYFRVTTGQLASVMGRYYAMDRDQRWSRTRVAYEALVQGQGQRTGDWQGALAAAYATGTSDEFLRPIILMDAEGMPRGRVQEG
ncbi:MAG: 2,3-bisphosphoglycerate-independent phosphoglycerate mutase, partial [Anaerolineae bacterium]|nr:2,3-bisphosphoglycerate-independent phosphoglycerate mutase [Anaerolineae bacterium]